MGSSWVLPVPVLVVPVLEEVGSLVLASELVKIVIARSGISLSPVFATERVRFVFSASFCLLGKLALTIWTGKSPSGSFASWRSPPHEATTAATRTAANPIPTRLRALTAGAVEALSSKGAGNIARTLPTPFGLRIGTSGASARARRRTCDRLQHGCGWRTALPSHNLRFAPPRRRVGPRPRMGMAPEERKWSDP